jgi:glutamate dehydrogenase
VLRGPLGAFAHSLEASRLVVGVPEDLAEASAMWPYAHTAFDIVDATRRVPGAAVRQLADIYWRLFEALDVTWLWDGIGALPRTDRWQTQSRSALRDDLLAVLVELTVDVASSPSASPVRADPAALVSQWLGANERTLTRMRGLFTEITRTGTTNLTTLTVGVRQLRNLVLGAQPAVAPAGAASQL